MAIKISGIDNPTQIKFVNNGTTTNITEVYYKAGPNSTSVKVWPDSVDASSVFFSRNGYRIRLKNKDINTTFLEDQKHTSTEGFNRCYQIIYSPESIQVDGVYVGSAMTPVNRHWIFFNSLSDKRVLEETYSFDIETKNPFLLTFNVDPAIIPGGTIGPQKSIFVINEIENGYIVPAGWDCKTISCGCFRKPLSDGLIISGNVRIYENDTFLSYSGNSYKYTMPSTRYLVVLDRAQPRIDKDGAIITLGSGVYIYTSDYWEEHYKE